MEVSVTFRHVEPSEGLRRYATEKVERLQRRLRKPIHAHVILSVAKQRHRAEVVLSGKSLNFSASEETKNLYSAIDLVIDKLNHHLERTVDKQKHHRGATAPTRTVALPAAEPTPKIKRQRASLRALSLPQAIARLRQSKTGFVLFESAESGAVQLLFERKDGELGLIDTEPGE